MLQLSVEHLLLSLVVLTTTVVTTQPTPTAALQTPAALALLSGPATLRDRHCLTCHSSSTPPSLVVVRCVIDVRVCDTVPLRSTIVASVIIFEFRLQRHTEQTSVHAHRHSFVRTVRRCCWSDPCMLVIHCVQWSAAMGGLLTGVSTHRRCSRAALAQPPLLRLQRQQRPTRCDASAVARRRSMQIAVWRTRVDRSGSSWMG